MRKWNLRGARWAAIAGLTLSLVPGAAANALYTYTGQPFNMFGTTYNTSDFIQVMLTLNSPLAANLPLTPIFSGIVSFQITDGVDPMGAFNVIALGMDASGAINQWDITNQSALSPDSIMVTANVTG